MATGFYHFWKKTNLNTSWAVAGASTAFFCVVLLAGEIYYQVKLRMTVPFVVPEASMTKQEFEEHIAEGRQLVILDELVLDVGEFIDQHPGGRFLLSHNIGRDVSKFYHGGYSLEDNIGGSPAKGYAHSSFSNHVVNDLAIARYQADVEVAPTICRVRTDLSTALNRHTKAVVFESVSGEPVVNWKAHYDSVDFIAKHFTIKTIGSCSPVTRHYTICNTMRPDLYSAYVRAFKPEDDVEY